MNAVAPDGPRARLVVRKKELWRYTGLRRTRNKELIDTDPDFPKFFPVMAGGRAEVCFEDELLRWQMIRYAKHTAKPGK
jgi:hypothetical protein